MIFDIAIVGTGVIGAMLARELTRYKLSVCMLEQAHDVACGASRANSGIVHGGYDPEPGTLKAKLNTEGVELLFETAKELNVTCIRNGSLVCAFSAEENETLKALYRRGQENKIPNLKILTGDEARALEPNLSQKVTGALHVPNAGIVCPYGLTIAAAGNAMDNGAVLKTDFCVSAIDKKDGIFTVTAQNGDAVQAKTLINCAGCGAGQVAALAGDDSITIIPRAGEYMLLDKTAGSTVKHTIFQVPTAAGKGILVSPTVHGNLLTGPNATMVADGNATETTVQGLEEVRTMSLKSVPSIDFRSVITSFSGVRASEKSGDFIIGWSGKVDGLLNVAAIDSPGLTCCVSIAKYVVSLLGPLEENPAFNGHRADPHAFQKMSIDQQDAFIKENPAYGKIVCRCETISEGEILDAIRTNPPARDMDGIKRRTRSGMGRCQGGFCGPYIMQLLAKEQHISMEQVTKSGGGSYMVIGKI